MKYKLKVKEMKSKKGMCMQKNKVNNIIVLKEMASNFVEEAIVVLKPNIEFKNDDKKVKNNELSENEKNKNRSIVKEAEFIIENSLNKLHEESKKNEKKEIEEKYKKMKKLVYALVIINVLLLFKLF